MTTNTFNDATGRNPLRRSCPMLLAAAAVLLTGFAGCQQASTMQNPTSSITDAAGVDGSTTDEADAVVDLQVVDQQGYEEAIAKHNGNVVLVDFWATWCVPCRQQFPHTVEMSRQYADGGLAVVSLSIDEPEAEAEVLKFLRQQGASFDNLLSTWGAGTESMEAFDIVGSVPYFKLYDRSGKLRYRFNGAPNLAENTEGLDQIEPRIRQLLAEG